MKKITSKHGLEADVSHSVHLTKDSLHVIKIVAICGSCCSKPTHTIGSVDTSRPKPPTTEELQKQLDKWYQEAADDAAWKESVRQAMPK